MRKTLMAVGLTFLFSASALFAQDKPGDKPADPPKADTPKEKDENPAPNYVLPKDADLEATLAFMKQLEAYRPTSRESATAHRRKMTAIIGGVIEKVVTLSEAEGKIDTAQYLDAKRAMLQRKASAAGSDPDVARAALDEIVAFLGARKKLTPADSRLAVYSGYYFLRSGDDSEEAQEVFASIVKQLSSSQDEQVQEDAKRVEGLARRAVLIGSDVKIAGTKLDGTPFDLSSLKGKVVLVDFWATWCGPCLREHPNIEANYEKYHERGFEVVGISLDRNRQQLESHVKKSETPWIILHEEGGKSEAATHYGVFGIPSMFLIDIDGKVVSTTARGPKLGEELEKLLGSKKKDPDSNEEKSGDK